MREHNNGIHIEYAGETRHSLNFDPHALEIPEGCPPEVRERILKKREELKKRAQERIRQRHGKN